VALPADHPFPQVDAELGKPWGGVLAGGAGQRLGGVDKGWLMLHGRPLVQHVIEAMGDHCTQVVINANRHLADYAALQYPVVPDIDPYAGPLGGMVSLFAAYPQHRLWLIAPCDTVGWPDDLVPALLARYRQGRYDVVIAGCDGRPMPVLGLYGPSSQAHLLCAFQEGERSPWRALHGLRWDVLWLPPGTMVNINTPEALQAATATEETMP
jgi:molybdopterin-guanine dinucleotide biosynthesis protein A